MPPKKPKKKKEQELPPGWYEKQAIPPSPYKAEGGPLFIPPDVAEALGRFPKETIRRKAAEMQQHLRKPDAELVPQEAQSLPPSGNPHEVAIKKIEAERRKAEAAARQAEKAALSIPGGRQAAVVEASKVRDALGRPIATNVPRPGGVGKGGLEEAVPGKAAKKSGIDVATGAFADPKLRAAWDQQAKEAVAEALLDPESFFEKLSKGSLKGESYLRKFRTKSQRLNTYGLWFIEHIQHNPAHSVAKFILNSLRGFGPHGVAISGAIAAIASSVFVLQQSIKNFAEKGLPLNIDFHRSIATEVVGLFTLEEQKRRDLGLAGVIADPVDGYKPVDGTEIYNTREVADSVRLTKLTQEEKARRYY